MCVELICCLMNRGYSSKTTLVCVLVQEILQEIDCIILHGPQLLICCYNLFEFR